jgi:hypothetical protein
MLSSITNDRISELQELVLRQGYRIASLETRLGRQNEIFSERLKIQEQQFLSELESLKSEIFILKEEHLNDQREKTEIISRLGFVEEHEEEQIKKSIEVSLRSQSEEIMSLKSDLISQAVLPEVCFIPTGDRIEGIIAHFTRECGGNVADCGIIEITSSSVYDDSYNAKYVADLTDVEHIFASKNEGNQWIEWNFKTAEIEPTHYSIRTTDEESGASHLQNWVLEGRIGNEKWRVLDERHSDSQLNGKNRIAMFDISTRSRGRMIRLRQIGPNHAGGSALKFCCLELFGGLFKTTRTDWRLLSFRSLMDEIFEMKSMLIGKAVLPERFQFSTADPFEGMIAHFTRECGGND